MPWPPCLPLGVPIWLLPYSSLVYSSAGLPGLGTSLGSGYYEGAGGWWWKLWPASSWGLEEFLQWPTFGTTWPPCMVLIVLSGYAHTGGVWASMGLGPACSACVSREVSCWSVEWPSRGLWGVFLGVQLVLDGGGGPPHSSWLGIVH